MRERDTRSPLTEAIVAVLKEIPFGRVASYGSIAARAGSPNGARTVVRILNSLSEKENLPWHRVVNREGRIVLPMGGGFELQKALLEREGVGSDESGRIDLERFFWR
jgi:methylated-DNA-protein-cysteine methyltransferase related protein